MFFSELKAPESREFGGGISSEKTTSPGIRILRTDSAWRAGTTPSGLSPEPCQADHLADPPRSLVLSSTQLHSQGRQAGKHTPHC